jgi:uncharacterized protein YceK
MARLIILALLLTGCTHLVEREGPPVNVRIPQVQAGCDLQTGTKPDWCVHAPL